MLLRGAPAAFRLEFGKRHEIVVELKAASGASVAERRV